MISFRFIISIIIITFGALVAAGTLELVLIPNQMIDGGINGISIILNTLFGGSLGLFVLVLNIPFLIVGYRILGKKFVFKTGYGMVLFSVLLEVFGNFDPLIDDTLLATVYGGVAMGVGGCLDGTETIGILLSRNNSLSVGQVVFILNIFIYGSAIFVFGADRALYSLLTYFITYKVIDIVSDGFDSAKAVFIITDDASYIADNVLKRLGRTVTAFDGRGYISKQEKTILYTVITRFEISVLRDILDEAPVSSFVTVMDVSEIIGNHIKKFPAKNQK